MSTKAQPSTTLCFVDTSNSLTHPIPTITRRSRIGAAARKEVGNWDWRAATMHLLHVQYPIAVAAAALRFGPRLGVLAQEAYASNPEAAAGGGKTNTGGLQPAAA